MSASIAIRRATSTDLDALVPLFDAYRRFYRKPSAPDPVRVFLADRFRNGDSIVFLAGSSPTAPPFGFVQLYPIFSSLSIGRALILNDLFVAPDSRGAGAGRALLERAAEFGREIGALYLELATETSNTRAQRIYEAAGWVRDLDFHHYSFDLR